MNPELWLVLIPALSAMLFAMGGTQISDKIEGQKWVRRFVLPFIWGLCVYLAHFALWQALGVMIVGCAMLHLGYGSKTPWGLKIATFAGYGAISLFIGVSWWNPIVAVGCAVMFLLSNLKLTSATVVWKCVEGIMGGLIGLSIAFLLAGNGIVWFR